MLKLAGIHPETHRDFDLGWFEGRFGYKAGWKPPGGRWIEGHILVDAVQETIQLAKECIDFYLKVQAEEKRLGRTLTDQEMRAITMSTQNSPAIDQAKFDQASAFLGDNIPPMLFRMFKGYQDAGFTEEQAFELAKTYLIAQFGKVILTK